MVENDARPTRVRPACWNASSLCEQNCVLDWSGRIQKNVEVSKRQNFKALIASKQTIAEAAPKDSSSRK